MTRYRSFARCQRCGTNVRVGIEYTPVARAVVGGGTMPGQSAHMVDAEDCPTCRTPFDVARWNAERAPGQPVPRAETYIGTGHYTGD